MEVLIDGVLYVPAKDVVSNRLDVARALLLEWWGDCDNEKAEEFISGEDVYVNVNDEGEGVRLSSILDNLATV